MKNKEEICGKIQGSCSTSITCKEIQELKDPIIKIEKSDVPEKIIQKLQKLENYRWNFQSANQLDFYRTGDQKILAIHSYRCAVDDYAVDAYLDGKPYPYENRLETIKTILKDLSVLKIVPWKFKDHYLDPNYQIEMEHIPAKFVYDIQSNIIILNETVNYDPNLGLIFPDS